ncbi:alpha/beta fold hydrolase [Pasteurella multocida]|nr:alpha/beta fold hydrolase [Pasteurella multocida]MDY0577454.1 alpha/beta fold hydrolase [Pasteurella multocida]MEB3457027.1 alpha/beta fold hydrolase [Pasteurella multocida]MEB3497972.1 alpha/beta fold hydrolase [Pasteurella multocida]
MGRVQCLTESWRANATRRPRRGQAGRSTVPENITAAPDDQFWFAQFRISEYPNFNQGVQFPQDATAQEQFFRTITSDTGAFDVKVVTDSMSTLFDKTGDGVLVTHSAGGVIDWLTAIANPKVKGIVAYEQDSFPFPEGEVPPTMTSAFGDVAPMKVSAEQFAKLTKLPIVIYFGDFISDKPSDKQGENQWYIRMKLAKQWADVVNKHGGNTKVVHLPKIGIKGNTHFPLSDLNNDKIADLMADWLKGNGLDK